MTRVFEYCIFLVGLVSAASAQTYMGLEEAIKIGLEKNFAVVIAKNQNQIAQLQNNLGNAGMSPQLSVNGGAVFSNINSFQEFVNGTTQERNNAQSSGYSAALHLDMKVYDGSKMFAIKSRLNQTENLTALQLRQQMENLIYEVMLAYYNIVSIDVMIRTEKQNLLIYQERKKIAKLKMEVGSDSKVDFLLSQSDENRAKSTIVQMELQMLDAKTKLNNLIGLSPETDYTTEDTIMVNYSPTIEDLKKNLTSRNAMILIAKQQTQISEQYIKEARSSQLPYLNLGLDYRYLNNKSQAGFLAANNQNGLFAELTAGWLLFNGNKNRNLVREMNLQNLNQQIILKQTELEVDALVQLNYRRFLLSKQIAELELSNLMDSRELQVISMERYRVGKTNLLEIIEAQKNLEDAQYRYINALYSVKIAEAELLRANGELVK
ncbi:MAG: TolC family protein [Bacteroidia bacterium]|nr:TolC family protein [Bacteroidia bacterium]